MVYIFSGLDKRDYLEGVIVKTTVDIKPDEKVLQLAGILVKGKRDIQKKSHEK